MGIHSVGRLLPADLETNVVRREATGIQDSSVNNRSGKYWPPGDSLMAALVRKTDWAATPLGPVERWPQGLRIAVDIALGSRHPMFVAWGPQLTFIFNDAYAPLLGTRLAGATGRPFAQLWADIWADIKPLIDTALAGGATWAEDLPLLMTRNGFEETAYFTFHGSAPRPRARLRVVQRRLSPALWLARCGRQNAAPSLSRGRGTGLSGTARSGLRKRPAFHRPCNVGQVTTGSRRTTDRVVRGSALSTIARRRRQGLRHLPARPRRH